MLRRAAIAIIIVAFVGFAALWIKAERIKRVINCHRDLAMPYEQLLDRMQQLADAGDTEGLRTLITRAREASEDLGEQCFDPKADSAYGQRVSELTK